MQLHVADVADTGQVHHHTLEAQTETGVTAGAVAAQVAVPPVILGVHAQLLDAALQQLQALLTLAAADDLADAGDQAVRGGHGLAVIVHPHVEGLDLLGIVGDEHGLLVHLLGEVALMLGLQVAAPVDLVVELVVVLLQNGDGLGVGHPAKVGVGYVLQTLDEALVHEAVEEGQLVGALAHDLLDGELNHGLSHVHVALQVGEGHFRLDHPELGGVALGVGVLRPEGGTEGVHIAEGHGKVLGVELAGDGQVGGLAEEVLGVVDGAVLVAGGILGIQSGDPEHLAGALAVAGGDDGSVNVDEAPLLEELVDGVGRHAPHPEGGGEQVRPGTQMLDGPQELHAVALLLQGIVGGGDALHLDGGGLQLQGLFGPGSQHHGAGDDEGGAHVLGRDLGVVGQSTGLHDHLQVFEAGAVVQLYKAEVLHVPDGAGPTAHSDFLAAQLFAVGENCSDFCIAH